jgi:hypothetical protein
VLGVDREDGCGFGIEVERGDKVKSEFRSGKGSRKMRIYPALVRERGQE